MAIPDYQSFMLPLLKLASDGEEHSIKTAVGELSDRYLGVEAQQQVESVKATELWPE